MAETTTNPEEPGVPFNSWAVWGTAVFAALSAFEPLMGLPPGTAGAVGAALVKVASLVVAAIGFRRRLPRG